LDPEREPEIYDLWPFKTSTVGPGGALERQSGNWRRTRSECVPVGAHPN